MAEPFDIDRFERLWLSRELELGTSAEFRADLQDLLIHAHAQAATREALFEGLVEALEDPDETFLADVSAGALLSHAWDERNAVQRGRGLTRDVLAEAAKALRARAHDLPAPAEAEELARVRRAIDRLTSGRPGYHAITVKELLTTIGDALDNDTSEETD